FDLGEIESVDENGYDRWRQLLSRLTGASSIVLVDIPDPLLPAIAEQRFDIHGATMFSFRGRFRCAECGNEEISSLRADESFATSSRSCPCCGRASHLVTDVQLLERVMAVAPEQQRWSLTPAIEALIASRQELLARARAESGSVVLPSATGDSLSRYRVLKP